MGCLITFPAHCFAFVKEPWLYRIQPWQDAWTNMEMYKIKKAPGPSLMGMGVLWCCHARECPAESSVWLLNKVLLQVKLRLEEEEEEEEEEEGTLEEESSLFSLTLCRILLNFSWFSRARNTGFSVVICVSYSLFLSAPALDLFNISVADSTSHGSLNFFFTPGSLSFFFQSPTHQFSFTSEPPLSFFIASPLLISSLFRVTFWWDGYWFSAVQCVGFTLAADESIGWNPMQVPPTCQSQRNCPWSLTEEGRDFMCAAEVIDSRL